MPFVHVNGVRINYIQIPCQSGSGEDLVMVHGLATSMAFWYFSHAPELAERYRVTLYDLRGHGRSGVTGSGYTARNMATDLEHLLDALGIRQPHIAAHSFGGAVALNLACRAPERFASLMLFDTHIYAMRRCPRPWNAGERIRRILDENKLTIDVRDPFFGYKLLTEVSRLKVLNREVTPGLDELVSPLMGRNSRRTAALWLHLMETTQAESELTGDDGLSPERLRRLQFPLLAAYGEHSPAMTTGEQLLDIWPHADFRRIRDAGHFFPVTKPLAFREVCRRFWNSTLMNGVHRREGDAAARGHFRSNRFYNRGDAWFFDTREAGPQGPFGRLPEARAAFATGVMAPR